MAEPIDDDLSLGERYSLCWTDSAFDDPDSTAFLASHPLATPSEQLEVLLLDQVYRARNGRPRQVEDYLAAHPELTDDPEVRLKLIQGELLARLERGEDPDPATLIAQFPPLAEEIRTQCEVDQWLSLQAAPITEGLSQTGTVALESTEDGGLAQPPERDSASASTLSDFDAPLREADFELMGRLGVGGMGEVFQAFQRSLRKPIAVKLMHREALDSPSRVRRFVAEARALARLRHPNIVGVHGIGRMRDGRHFLVMDLIEGGETLATLIKDGPVSFERAAALVASIAEAIEHAHSHGVVHRDLKPSNVLVDAEGKPHITDFGLAKVFDQTDPDHPSATGDQILGTPHYMSPEQADPVRGMITSRTDVYGLGAILFSLLTGKPPIQGESITHLLTQIVSPDPVRSPRELRPEIPAGLG